jgi:oxygen-independent coproporphyrinogen-3 oxidase
VESITHTLIECLELKPDRVAFYSYAHVPWTSRGQRLFDEDDLPTAMEKMQLYLAGRQVFADHGYEDIGMDHFALKNDELYVAFKENRLFRNFMGYTTQQSKMQIGLGVSAISDSGNAFVQNSKTIHDYSIKVSQGELPIVKGYFLNNEDITFRRYILDLICNNKAVLRKEDIHLLTQYTFPALRQMENDALVLISETFVSVREEGRPFIRNICSAFDLHLLRSKKATEQLFSNAV